MPEALATTTPTTTTPAAAAPAGTPATGAPANDAAPPPETMTAKQLAELAEHDRFVRKFRKEFETVKPHAAKWSELEAKRAEGLVPALEHIFGREFLTDPDNANQILDYIAKHGRAPTPEQVEAKKAEDEERKFEEWQKKRDAAAEKERRDADKAQIDKGRALMLQDVNEAYDAAKYPFVSRIGADENRVRATANAIYKSTGKVPTGAEILDAIEEIYSGVPRSSGTAAPGKDATTAPAQQGTTAPPSSSDPGTKIQASTMTEEELDADIRRRLRENEAKRKAAQR